jgi:hypothetical protein
MWLDESQTVAIAQRPLGSMFSTLRIDGSPPAFYLLLHAWIAVVGTGTEAVRALSGVVSLLTLPAAWLAARRLGMTRQTAWIATALLATSPFAVRYATEARMYSLVLLLTLMSVAAYERVWRSRSALSIAAAALVTAALLLTHYWALFAYAIAGATVIVLALRGSRPALRCLIALGAGGVPFLFWLPTFVYQTLHTGAPWGKPAGLDSSVLAPSQWSGADTTGTLLAGAYYALLLVALLGRRRDDGSLGFARPLRRLPLALVLLGVGTLLLGALVGEVLGSAYASRYSIIALGPLLLAVAAGVAVIPPPWRLRVAAGACLLGLASSATLPAQQRTQAQTVADRLSKVLSGDVVAFCPDQLGPAVHRLAPDAGQQVVYPTLGPAEIVNWVDYKDRIENSSPGQFTHRLMQLAGGHSIWLVYATDYPLLAGKCSRLLTDLTAALGRPRIEVQPKVGLIERDGLAVFHGRGS